MKFAGMLQHTITPIRREDAETYILGISYVIMMRKIHCAGVKCSDLIVSQISGDECLCGESVTHGTDMSLCQIQFLETIVIGLIVIPYCSHDQGRSPNHL